MRGTWVAVAVVASILGAAGCSGDGDAALRLAQADVEKAQQALTDAQTQAQTTHDEFCGSSVTYIGALDRYGDVLNQTAPTVGDVRTAGRDLQRPQEDVVAAGTAAVEARNAVGVAEQELVDAQARLEALTATGGAGTAPDKSASPPKSAEGPSEAVARVEQAQAEFESVTTGITDATPLRTASEQVNAAVVALEFAWLQLFSDAGCLTDEQQKTAAQVVHDYTAALQQQLKTAGYFTEKVDGVYGPSTVAAVEALQQAHGLPVTGTVDAATQAALRDDLVAQGGVEAVDMIASTAALQQTLKLAGYWDGPVDGEWSPALTDALKKFQKELGVPVTGAVDAATVKALEKAIAAAQSPAPTSQVPTPTVTVTVTPSP